MDSKLKKSFRTLASDLKARRKRELTETEINKLNKIFDDLKQEQAKKNEDRKIARENEV